MIFIIKQGTMQHADWEEGCIYFGYDRLSCLADIQKEIPLWYKIQSSEFQNELILTYKLESLA